MKFTLSWLKEYLDTTATLDDISTKLTAIGLEVEGIDDPAKTLNGFIVGHVLSAEKHPDADKLKCLIVDTGKEQLKVVCGAPNARAGMKGVFAPAGSYIPGTGITLKKSLIRGAESNGMMCSGKELCLSEESDGIIDLKTDLPAGSSAVAALGINDPVIEINLTPNRGDCAGIYGIARDLAAAGLGKLKTDIHKKIPVAGAAPVAARVDDAKACPQFMLRLIKDVKNGPSPEWLHKRLTSIGLRPISALVDITNYMTIAFNRPLHVFDAGKVKGNITLRAAKKGESFAALNDKTYTLEDGMTVICDDTGVISLAGVIGGASTGVTEATRNVYLEIAQFDTARTAATGRALMIDSDARYRFERGINPAFLTTGADIATDMILSLCGGSASPLAATGTAPAARHVAYDPALLHKLGGLDLPPQKQKEILFALGFGAQEKGAVWDIALPSWRHDIDGAPDIVEEILRIHGYDTIPATPVRLPENEQRRPINVLSKRASTARRFLAARGLNEAVTWAFMDEKSADLFGAAQNQNKAALTLSNPISADLSVMRPSALANLIAAAASNADRGIPGAALFEIGAVYRDTTAQGQVMTATGLRSGDAEARHWSGPARGVDAFDAKADALAVIDTLGVNTASLQITRDAPEYYHPGRSGALRLGPTIIGFFGDIHPKVLARMKRDEAYCGFEIFLSALPQPKKKGPRKELLKLSPLQPVTRDFAFVVDEKIEAEKILRHVKAVDKTLITDISLFDIYQGKGVEAGKKSFAFSVTLQPVDKTLTDDEIQAISKKIIDAVTALTGGSLRQ
jgi:phenylalanyl-tRNA synthetase beta chain